MKVSTKRNNVKVAGSGSQGMVFAHGFGCDQSMWRFLLPEFNKNYRTVAFDHVGAGNSDSGCYDAEKYSNLGGYASDLTELVDDIGLRDSVFVGHSVSAMIGILAAIRRPDLFSNLILIGPSPCYFNDGEYRGGFERSQIDALLSAVDQNYLGWARAMAPAIMGNSERPELGTELTNSFCRTNPEFARQFARVVFMSDNRSDVKLNPVPSLILQCSQDIVAPESVGRYLHANMANSELVVLRATGHCPHVSEPEETLASIRHYLDLDAI